MKNNTLNLDKLSNFNISQELFSDKNSKVQKNQQKKQQFMQKQKANISSLDLNAGRKNKISKRKNTDRNKVSFERVKNRKQSPIDWYKLYEDFDSEQDDDSFDGSNLENQTINLQFFSRDDEKQLVADSQIFTQQGQEIDILKFIQYDQEKQKNKQLYPCKICKKEFSKAALGGHMTKIHRSK